VRPQPWLWPLGLLWGGAAALKAASYRSGLLRAARLSSPVISVGNLRAGGSGKTPLVAWIAALLRDAGQRVAILSRGYGGRFAGDALLVSDGHTVRSDAATAGDEPVMLAHALPGVVVAVGRRRDVVGRWLEARHGRFVCLLDDGFQHLRLHRDLDLVCVEATDLADRPLPSGHLREFPSALARADLLLVAGAPHPAFDARRSITIGRRADGFHDAAGVRVAAPARPFLVSGIARPERFRADVTTLASDVAGHLAFPDHHRFSPADVASALAAAHAAHADAIVTTAKDAVRLSLADGEIPWRVLRIAVTVADDRLRERVLAVAAAAA
jgi:tetraacyldisaccharide 4'-kinase